MNEIYDEFYNSGGEFKWSSDEEDPIQKVGNGIDMIVVHRMEKKDDHEIYENKDNLDKDTINDVPHISDIDDEDNEDRCSRKVSINYETMKFKKMANESVEFR